MKKNLFIDIHAIQTIPPSNLNRDDTGSPKTATFGGVRRARVSSQSWKYAMRNWFVEHDVPTGVRTVKVPEMIAGRIKIIDSSISDDEAMEITEKALGLIGKKGLKTDKDSNKLKALFFISPSQIDRIAQAIVDNHVQSSKTLKRDLNKILSEGHAYDMSLFGRMIADDPSINIDAAVQVAHAVSVGKVNSEFDFYTGKDDKSSDDTAGATMMGNIEFDSSVLYRYANIGVTQLRKNLGDNTDAVIECLSRFIEAFLDSMPTGKQNSFGAQTLPSTVVVEIRDSRPVSYVEAFVKPVANDPDVAAKTLVKYAETINDTYNVKPVKSFVLYLTPDDGVQQLGEPSNESELVERTADAIRELL